VPLAALVSVPSHAPAAPPVAVAERAPVAFAFVPAPSAGPGATENVPESGADPEVT